MDYKLKNLILKGSIWSILGQFSALFINLGANIWLARLLTPIEFGRLGIIMAFIAVSNILTEGGLSGALIRKVNVTKEDYSTIFIVNMCVSIFCFLVIFFSASYVAQYYNDPHLIKPLIIASFVLIINAMQLVQNTRLMAKMEYKKKAVYDFSSIFLSSIIGVLAAYKGLGIWSLVYMQLTNSLFKTIFLWSFEKFYFKLVFNKTSFKELYRFGINTTLSSILNVAFDNIYQLILAKMFSISQVGFYYQAKRLNDVNSSVFNSISQGPVYSGLVQLQNDKILFLQSYNKIVTFLLSALGLITVLVFYYSDIIILTLFGEKWVDSGLYLKFLIIASYFFIQENFNRVIFKTFNQTHKILYLDILKKFIQLISIVIGVMSKSIHILLIGFIIANAIGYSINYYVSRSVVNLKENVNKELRSTYVVLLSVFITIIVSLLMSSILGFDNYLSLISIFIIIPLYFLLLKFFHIFNLFPLFKVNLKRIK